MSSSASSDKSATSPDGPSGLAILAFMGLGMLLGIVLLAWLGSPRLKSALGQSLSRVELQPLLYADKAISEADLVGKVTLLHFWGTWCSACLQEYPEFIQAAEQLQKSSDIQILSVSSSQGPEHDIEQLKQLTREFMERHASRMPTYCDPAGLTRGQAGMLLPDNSLPYPSTYLLDRQGKLAGVWLGYKPGNMELIKEASQQLLSIRPVESPEPSH